MRTNIYKKDTRWILIELLKIGLICVVVGILFFNSMLGFFWVIPFGGMIYYIDEKDYIKKIRKQIQVEFKDFIVLLSGSLNAGYSLENAFVQAFDEFYSTKGNSSLGELLQQMVYGLGYNHTVENMMLQLGKNTKVQEILEFAHLIKTSKQYGGNMIKVIRQTANSLVEKYSVESEIETMISAKKLEGKIMMLAPVLVLIYMRLTNGVYMEVLYSTFMGKSIMCIAVVVVAVCGLIIHRIMDIEV